MKTGSSLPANARRSLKTYWNIARGELIGYVFGATGQVIAVLVQTWFAGRIINDLIRAVSHHQTSLHPIAFDVTILIISTTAEQTCWALLTYFEKRAYNIWSRHNYFVFLNKTSSLSLSQFEDKEFQRILNMLTQEGYPWKPINFVSSILYAFHGLLRMVSTFVILVTLIPILIPVLLIASLPTLLIEKQSAASRWGVWNTEGDQSQLFWQLASLLQYRDSVTEIIPQGSKPYLLEKADSSINIFLKKQMAALRRFLGLVLGTRIFEGAVVGGINLYLLSRVITSGGRFSVGKYSIYSGIVFQFQNSVSTVYRSMIDVFDYNNFMTNYYYFLDSQPGIQETAKPIKLPPDQPITIEFKNVSFTYPGSDKAVLEHIDLTIKPGDHIAIVGQNGAGKSTLIKLLMRFYDVSDGQIVVNGHDIRELDLSSWYYHIGALFQYFNRYPFTLAENVSIGRIEHTNNTSLVNKAMKLARIDHMSKEWEHRDETVLNPSFTKGTELSGGQWQKVALGRAFFRDAAILILDEPTSAVDAKAEYEIFEQIKKTQADKTTLIVSHRFSTVRQADRILVIQNGQIAEDGSHEQLVKQNGLYKDLFEKQAAGYR